jgi:hypothetical protein
MRAWSRRSLSFWALPMRSFSDCQAWVSEAERSSRSDSSFSSVPRRSRDAESLSFFKASRSILSWMMRRSSSSSSSGLESTCIRTRAAASSTRSMALSGRKRSVM